MLNRNFKDFKFRHQRNENQILYTYYKTNNYIEILNLIDNFLKEKNSFIFESVEKGKIRGRYTIFGLNPDKECLNDSCNLCHKTALQNQKGLYF